MGKIFGMKDTTFLVLAIGLGLVLFYGGYLTQFGWSPPQGAAIQTSGGGTGTQTINKPVLFTLRDKYGGGILASQTLNVYDTSFTLLDTLTTDASGQKPTTASHQTGEHLWVQAIGSTGERKWFNVVVPGMSSADAQSLTQVPVSLDFYDYTAPTMAVVFQNGTTASDGGFYNHTTTGNNGVFTVSWFQGTTGNGYDASYDPIYAMQNDAILVMKVSGTNYDKVGVTGMSGGVERASAMYYYTIIDPSTLTKWQVGNDFRYPGVGSHTVSVELSGYTGQAADVDFYIYYFADWTYFIGHGSFGPNALSVISGAPYTINLGGYP